MSSDFQQKYGPWAIIAGGALGLGEAWANALASRGVNIVSLPTAKLPRWLKT